MEKKKPNILTEYIIPGIGAFCAALDLFPNMPACWLMFVVSLVLIGLCIFIRKGEGHKLHQYVSAYADNVPTIRLCSIIVGVMSLSGIVYNGIQEHRMNLLEAALSEAPPTQEAELKALADAGDGPATYNLAEYYLGEQDYMRARDYAQVAADKGNPAGYGLLAYFYYMGLGCKVDYQRAIANLIEGEKRGPIKYDHVLEYISKRGYEISRKEMLSLEQASEGRERMGEMKRTIRQMPSDDPGAIDMRRAYLQENEKELQRMSNNGNVQATALLYDLERLSGVNGSRELSELSAELYKVNYIPTSDFDRHSFFRYYYGDEYESNDKWSADRIIRDNDYYGYSRAYEDSGDEKVCSDDLLIDDYRIFRAKNRWYGLLEDGRVPAVYYSVSFSTGNEKEYNQPRVELMRAIKGIQKRIGEKASRN